MRPDDEKREMRFGEAVAIGVATYVTGSFLIVVLTFGNAQRMEIAKSLLWSMPFVAIAASVVTYFRRAGSRDSDDE